MIGSTWRPSTVGWPWALSVVPLTVFVVLGAISAKLHPEILGLDPTQQVLLLGIVTALVSAVLSARAIGRWRARAELAERKAQEQAHGIRAATLAVHNLRQPLTALRAYAQWIEARPVNEAQLRMYCRDMLVACDEMETILAELELATRYRVRASSQTAMVDVERVMRTLGE